MFKKVILLTSAGLLAACGGGSGGSGDGLKTGKVEGLAGAAYRTESQSGLLNSNGEYRYKDGETVSILVGNVELGSRRAGNTTLVQLLDLNKLPEDPAVVRGLLRLPEYSRDLLRTSYQGGLSQLTSNNLHMTSNKMRLLIALDDDDNAANGFDISAHQAAFNNLELDLNHTLYQFATSDAAMAFQHTSGISLAMDNARPLREAYALAQLSVEVPQRMRVENGAEFSYDTLSRVASKTQLDGPDVQTTNTYTYSNTGGLLSEVQISEPYGESSTFSPTKLAYSYSYNDFGQPLSYQTDQYVKGNISQLQSTRLESRSYLNNRVLLTRTQNTEDDNADGQTNYSSSVRREYNEQLQLTSSKTFTGTNIEDETFSYGEYELVYDDQNRLTGYKHETTGSDTVQTYQFNYQQVDGNSVATRTVTRAADKRVTEETISPNGKLLKRVLRTLTLQDEVTAATTVYYSYNDGGLISECRLEEDNNNDGNIDATARSQLSYSGFGLSTIATTKDTNGDGTPDAELTHNFIYGDDGEVVSTAYGSFVYGNNAENGISYLINEYSNEISGFSADEKLVVSSQSNKCDTIFTYGEND